MKKNVSKEEAPALLFSRKKRLSPELKIRIIKQVLAGKKISVACREHSISRTTFYSLLKRYKDSDTTKANLIFRPKYSKGIKHWKTDKKGSGKKVLKIALSNPRYSIRAISSITGFSVGAVWKILHKRSLTLENDRKKHNLLNGTSIYRTISQSERMSMIRQYQEGRPVSQICRDLNISRTIFYRWLKRYEASDADFDSLKTQRPSQEAHWRFTGGLKKEILYYIENNPHSSLDEIYFNIAQKKQINISRSGFYYFLKRLGLNTIQDRQRYFASKESIGRKYSQVPAFDLPELPRYSFLSFLSPPIKSLISYTFYFSLISLSTFLLSILSFFVFKTFLQGQSISYITGFITAAVSLLFGFFFFLYSLKYYFSISVVLSFSRRDNDYKSENTNFFSRILGISISVEDDANIRTPKPASAIGLQADLSSVILKSNPFVSVHLSSYNEKRVIDRLLTACTSFDYPNYEVIVADDSTDETVSLLDKWANHPRVKISHRQTRQGYKGGALDQALKITDPRAQFILVFDADFIPYPDTITQFLKYFQLATGGLEFAASQIDPNSDNNSNIAAVQGYQWHVLNKSENWITRGVRSEYSGSYVIERSGAEIYSGLKQISGSVYMIRRDVLQSVGWGTSITEDFELTLRLYEQGYKVVYTPYIQAPAEAVSTIKRLIRQRMRWAEGHSFNIKRMLKTLLASPRLTLSEKLELIYLAPYYLQAAFFILGTLCWFTAEVIFQVRLPFWTEIWGWSLVATNLAALPLMNMIGLFMEETEEKDYLGLFSFIVLTYIVAPFQAYAAVKGFLEKEEGPWFRTPKTGRITDRLSIKRISSFVRVLFGHPGLTSSLKIAYQRPVSSYLKLTTANNQFNSFRHRKKNLGKFGKSFLVMTILLSLMLNSLAFGVKPTQAWYSTYAFRKLITIDHTLVPNTDQANFPVLVSLTDTALIYDAAGAGGHHVQTTQGFDIVFADTSDVLLPFERESYDNATGKIVMWVRITSLSHTTDNTFYIYYGKPSDTEHADPATVWNNGGSNNFKGVWHLGEASGSVNDSTTYGTAGTINGTPTQGATGQIGKAVNFSTATGNYISMGDPADGHLDFGTGNFSYELWLNMNASTATWQDPLDKGGNSSGDFGYMFETATNGSNMAGYLTDTAGHQVNTNNATITAGAWAYYSVTADNTNNLIHIYKNGAEVGTAVSMSTIVNVNATLPLTIGGQQTNQHANMIIDEVHISSGVLSADWIKTEYNNQNNQGTGAGKFIKTYGTEEAVPEFLLLFLPLALAAPFLIRRLKKKQQERSLYYNLK